jgi:hypothetical protein
VKRLSADPSARLQQIEFTKCSAEGPFERSHRFVRATINGVPASMLIDTGASITVLARNNPALTSMLAKGGKRGTSVAIFSEGNLFRLPDVPIDVFGNSWKMPVVVNRVAQRCGDGAIGADLLSHCTLVWGWSALWAACRPS